MLLRIWLISFQLTMRPNFCMQSIYCYKSQNQNGNRLKRLRLSLQITFFSITKSQPVNIAFTVVTFCADWTNKLCKSNRKYIQLGPGFIDVFMSSDFFYKKNEIRQIKIKQITRNWCICKEFRLVLSSDTYPCCKMSIQNDNLFQSENSVHRIIL